MLEYTGNKCIVNNKISLFFNNINNGIIIPLTNTMF